jgi:hypothetical protein
MAEYHVKMIARTEKAILVRYDNAQEWIPDSLIHADSEIYLESDIGDAGKLVIPDWKGVQLGWE